MDAEEFRKAGYQAIDQSLTRFEWANGSRRVL
jgi:hypothetical protein